ncbi:hypothetical protein E1200_29935 [Actinomadura sp. GC306]|uniref:hypothetical protein n=1 Tax=Actinomadura sp. GC306 TaxID=2530367 RepID=UPI0010482ED3|nr:hypothetical protein [Actinomadura sp. GC306]TDC60777.1 hypothetical protein E1200_29935 [Actinomadura sp. GC306]
MKGRHRGQPGGRSAEDEVGERPRSSRRTLVAVAAAGALAVAASVIAFLSGGGPVDEEPQTAATSVQQNLPVIPGAEPTYGKYVPPEEVQAATKAPPKPAPVPTVTPKRTKPAPTQTPTATPSRSRTNRPCPPEWRDHWWMRRWCDDPRDRDGHRGR